MCFAPQRRTLFEHLNFQKCSEAEVLCTFWLRNVLRATTAYTVSTSQRPKVLWTSYVLYVWTSKCASRHKDVHVLNISTSKSSANMVCFVDFDFHMCFVPQQRALFRHLNFQKWSDAGVFLPFDLEMCFAHLRATTACNFSSLIWPHGSAPAALASHFWTLRSHKSLEKHSVSRLSYLFAHLDLLSSETLSFLIFFLLSSLLWLFPPLLFICPYCRMFDF